MTIEWHYNEREQEHAAQAGPARLRVSLRLDGFWMPSVGLDGLEIGPPFERVPDAQAWAIDAACRRVQPLIAAAVTAERNACATVVSVMAEQAQHEIDRSHATGRVLDELVGARVALDKAVDAIRARGKERPT